VCDQADWENNFLSLLHRLCTSELGPEGESLRRETFSKVERVFLMGLRACDPAMRAKFFALYSSSVSRTLFARLQFIVSGQDWEALSNSFWLSQGLDLLLSILIEDEAITLAPNSAQVPPLLAETKQHIFNPKRGASSAEAAKEAVAAPDAEQAAPPAAAGPEEGTGGRR
jgi:transformation/transcription domain-associated protein